MPGKLLSNSKVGHKKHPEILENKRTESIHKDFDRKYDHYKPYSDLNDLNYKNVLKNNTDFII